MLNKILSLSLSFLLLFSGSINAAGQLSLDDIKTLVSMPEKYSKNTDAALSMAVLAGMGQYEKIFTSVNALKEKLSVKEALLADMENARVLRTGKNVMIPMKNGNYAQDFPAMDNHYKWQKANVYEPAIVEVKKHRLAYIEFYKSPEIKAQWEAAEAAFAAVEKDFTTLEKQWNSVRNNLLKTAIPAQETALKREITLLKKEIASSQKAFIDAQYQIFKEEYTSLVWKLKNKSGMFMPAEVERFVQRMEGDLKRFQRAVTDDELDFARRAIRESIEKFSAIKPAAGGSELKFYKESLNKFFNNMSKRLSLKGSVPLLAAAGLVLFMLGAQSADAAGISNKNVIVARALNYSFKDTPQLMLANTIALKQQYGDEVVSNIIFENQAYIPLLQKQINTLGFIAESSSAEETLRSELVINSSDFKLPYTVNSFNF